MASGYQKDFADKLKKTVVLKNGESFNLEKEAKIINPHKMDMGTTSGSTYKNFKVIPKKKQLRKFEDEGKPIVAQSTYMKNFPNWKNGQGDIFHEKQPQYPFYSLPFKGDSSYAMNHNETQQRKLREHNQMLR